MARIVATAYSPSRATAIAAHNLSPYPFPYPTGRETTAKSTASFYRTFDIPFDLADERSIGAVIESRARPRATALIGPTGRALGGESSMVLHPT